MDSLNTTLAQANNDLAGDARRTIIEVDDTRVRQWDAAEFANVTNRTTNHQITISDRLGMYKTPGWHGLGEVISEGLSGREACDRFIGWRVVQEPVYTEIDGTKRILPLKANVRSDTKDLLGVVSQDYVVVQNHDIGDFADALLQESKESGIKVQMETCGSLLGGRKVFLTLRPDREIRVGRTGADVTIPYLTLLNGHDGSMAMTAAWTNVRVVCRNTYTSAINGIDQDVNAGKAFRIRHMGKVQDYLQQAKLCLGIAVKGLEQYQEMATKMADRKLSKETLRSFFEDAYRAMNGPFANEPANDLQRVQLDKANEQIKIWTDLMGDDTNLFDGIEGTLWAAFNAITHHQDHTRANSSRMGSQDRKDHSRLIGVAALDKRKAFRVAAKMLAI